MSLDEIQGKWNLIGSTSINSEIQFIDGEEPDPDGVVNWLNGVDDALVGSARPASGMVLSIAADGTFAERVAGNPEVYWFDVEGVLQAEVTPFDGLVVSSGEGVYLRPVKIAKWAIPFQGKSGAAVLRYDDGDTKITDAIRIVKDRLVRTVNVVTDELYLDRVLLIYERAY